MLVNREGLHLTYLPKGILAVCCIANGCIELKFPGDLKAARATFLKTSSSSSHGHVLPHQLARQLRFTQIRIDIRPLRRVHFNSSIPHSPVMIGHPCTDSLPGRGL